MKTVLVNCSHGVSMLYHDQLFWKISLLYLLLQKAACTLFLIKISILGETHELFSRLFVTTFEMEMPSAWIRSNLN